jgi:DNA helicase-2/ATP-dependent DNA helicase PcrA
MSIDRILDPLNPEQREAVTFTEGPLLILAGPGSGKTRVITHKIAYLLLQMKIDPSQILGVTFTNKAANEMRSRVEALIGINQPLPWIHTFHATCARILRSHISALAPSYTPSFTILDEGDQRDAITQAMKELDIPSEEISPGICSSVINRAKDELIGPEDFREKYVGRLDTYLLEIVDRVYRRYQAVLEKSNALDFADLLRLTVKLLHANLEILNYYRDRFRYILVDEYQDINHAQYIFTRTLAERSENISVVGDEDQAIFSWRGSDPSYILQFEQDFPNAKVVELRTHYRWPDGDRIFKAARDLISHNTMRVKSKDSSHLIGEGDNIQIYAARDQADEVRAVAREIYRLWQMEGIDIDEIAVLYRVNTLSRVIEEAFMRERIPYEVVRGLGFYQRREVKDLLSYLKFIANPHDEISLMRALERPKRGIGESTITVARRFAATERIPLWEAMRSLVEQPRDLLKSRQVSSLKEFVAEMGGWIDVSNALKPSELAQKILEQSGYLDEILKNPSDDERLGNIRELIGQLREYEQGENASLSFFLEQIALMSDVDQVLGEDARVALLTLHASKGLEFDYVFIIGLEEKLIPHTRSISEGMVEEERRLLYVGMTRARKRLYLSFAHQRLLYGNLMLNNPSPFLSELPADDLNLVVG